MPIMKHSYILLFLIAVVLSCSYCKKENDEKKVEEEIPVSVQKKVDESILTIEEDTTIYSEPPTTATIDNLRKFILENNTLKDWDKEKARKVMVQAIIEKDGRPTNMLVRLYQDYDAKSQSWISRKEIKEDQFTKEALRLISIAKINPATNENGEAVRSKWVIFISFPTE